jgi:hypothetical protein
MPWASRSTVTSNTLRSCTGRKTDRDHGSCATADEVMVRSSFGQLFGAARRGGGRTTGGRIVEVPQRCVNDLAPSAGTRLQTFRWRTPPRRRLAESFLAAGHSLPHFSPHFPHHISTIPLYLLPPSLFSIHSFLSSSLSLISLLPSQSSASLPLLCFSIFSIHLPSLTPFLLPIPFPASLISRIALSHFPHPSPHLFHQHPPVYAPPFALHHLNRPPPPPPPPFTLHLFVYSPLSLRPHPGVDRRFANLRISC